MKFSKILALICILVVTASLCTSGIARAQLGGPFAKKKAAAPAPVMLYPIQDEDSFQTVAKSFHKIPFNDPQLEFSMLLPKDWTSEETLQSDATGTLNRELVSEIAHFSSPVINTMRAAVILQSIKLEREISAESWLKNYIVTGGYDLQDKIVAVDDRKATANCVITSDGKSSYVQMLVQINGSNAVVVRFESPMYLKDSMAFLAKRSLDSFRFILATDHSIEVQKTFSFADVVKFSYPESWGPNNLDVKDSRSMSMQLYSKGEGGHIQGLIRFVVVKRSADTSLKKEVEDLKKYFDGVLKLDFKKLVSSDKAPTSSRFLFSRYEVYQVASKKEESPSNQEIRLVALGDKDWYVFAFLLTPADSENFYTWASNTQSFDMIVKSLK